MASAPLPRFGRLGVFDDVDEFESYDRPGTPAADAEADADAEGDLDGSDAAAAGAAGVGQSAADGATGTRRGGKRRAGPTTCPIPRHSSRG